MSDATTPTTPVLWSTASNYVSILSFGAPLVPWSRSRVGLCIHAQVHGLAIRPDECRSYSRREGGGGVGLLIEGVLMARVLVVGISRGVSIHKKRRRGWDGVT